MLCKGPLKRVPCSECGSFRNSWLSVVTVWAHGDLYSRVRSSTFRMRCGVGHRLALSNGAVKFDTKRLHVFHAQHCRATHIRRGGVELLLVRISLTPSDIGRKDPTHAQGAEGYKPCVKICSFLFF